MKNLVLYIICYSLFFSTGCKEDSWRNIFTFRPVESVKEDSIEELEQEAAQYEKEIDEKIGAAGRLGLIYQKIGEKYLDRKAWDAAIKYFEKAVNNGNSSPSVYYSLGVAYGNKAKDFGRPDDIRRAEEYYRKALKIEPDYHDARYGLAVFLFYVRDEKEEAIRITEGLVIRDKNYYPARFALGRFYYETGRPQRALNVFERLYSDLDSLAGSPQIDEYKRNCRDNIERLVKEIAEKK